MTAERPDRIELPCDRTRPAIRQPAWQRITRRCGGADAFAAFAVFVGKIANTRDVVIGRADGACVVHLDPDEPLGALAARLARAPRITALEASTDPARHALYDVGFGDGDLLGDLHVRITGGEFDLWYDEKLFSPVRARLVARALYEVMRASPDAPVGKIELLGEADAAEQLAELSTPRFNWPKHFVLHELFEAKADQTPGAIALAFGETRVTYRELDERANALAAQLIARGVGPDAIVALICERSIEMIVAILGVLKAGGADFPI